MKGFKLLAIRPLVGCNKEFLKVLREGELYRFYNNYVFQDESGNSNISGGAVVAKVFEAKSYNPYGTSKKPFLNFSAVVGMNGSGKSSLFELLYRALFMLSVSQKYLNDIAYYRTRIKEANRAGLSSEAKQVQVTRWRYEMDHIKFILDSLKLEIFYAIDDEIFCLYFNSKNEVESIKRNYKLIYVSGYERISELTVETFFYSIVTNYSIYGLNSGDIGSWINELFHKNDGYQTPIVLNPLRTQGVFDINDETHLAQCRILVNLLDEKMMTKDLVYGKAVEAVSFKLDEKKIEKFHSINLDNVIKKFLGEYKLTLKDAFILIYKTILSVPESEVIFFKRKNIKYFEKIAKYIIKKIFKISTYNDYRDLYYRVPTTGRPIPSVKNLELFLKDLVLDKSHKTLKLRQILNTVRGGILDEDKKGGFLWVKDCMHLTVEQLKERVSVAMGLYGGDVLEYIPGAFFKPEIQIKGESGFQVMSSGEQQMVNSIQTVCYHLMNLDSIFESKPDSLQENKYKNLNVIFDEIELYFHPEYQRRFIFELKESIQRLRFDHILNINFIFSTHSPFILSDIPISNILRLENGITYLLNTQQTYAANIYNILKNDFFLKRGFIGESAKERINSLLEFLTKDSASTEWNSVYAKEFIDLIGEDLIRNELMELYLTKFYDDNKIDFEIERLQALKKKSKQ